MHGTEDFAANSNPLHGDHHHHHQSDIPTGRNFSMELENDHVRKSIEEGGPERESRLSHQSSFSALYPTNSAALTTFLLLNAMIGSGILNQPYVFRNSGIVGGLIGFFIASFATWYGLLLLTAAGLHVDVLEYSGLARRAFQDNGEKLVDISIIVLAFGSQLGYILVVGTTLSSLLGAWGCNNVICGNYFTTTIAVGVFVTPICLFRHFGHLAWLSLFSITAIVIVIFLVLIVGPIKHQEDHDSSYYTVFNVVGFMQSIGSIVFALSCAAANFQAFITTEKSFQNMQGWSTITRNAVFAGACMCCFMGLVGYLCFSTQTDGMILDNFPQEGYDFFKIMVIAHLIFYIPVNFVIMRYSIVKLTLKTRSELLSPFLHSTISLGLLALVTVIVLAIYAAGFANGEGFALILNITGGIGGSLACFIIPSAIYLKLMPPESEMIIHAKVILGFGILVMLLVVIFTIIDLAT